MGGAPEFKVKDEMERQKMIRVNAVVLGNREGRTGLVVYLELG